MKNQYGFGQIMQSGHKIIFLIIVLLFYLSDFQINENSLIFILLLSAFFPSLIFVKYIYKASNSNSPISESANIEL